MYLDAVLTRKKRGSFLRVSGEAQVFFNLIMCETDVCMRVWNKCTDLCK